MNKKDEISLYQASKRIHPRWIMGLFSKCRVGVVLVTQFVFFILPWFNYDGRQAVLFDIANRHFYLFGLVLLPGDLIFLSGLLFLCAFGLFWWTTIAGRLWCGYACPQTVYTEIMLWLDRLFEGDRPARMKLEKAPWDIHKIRVKSLKYFAIFLFCVWVGLTFIGWFSPIREVFRDFASLSLSGTQWFAACFYAFLTFFFGHVMREQVCKFMCPYARFQSAMFDKDTLIISYDNERGEPRGIRKKGMEKNQELGDCVNCTMCVQVCPVGIDIRDGLQYECIGCAACVDACDGVMDKMHKPRGLIRYTTEAAMEKVYPESKILSRLKRPRVVGYGTVLLVVLTALIVGLSQRQLLRVDIIKDRGVMVRENTKGWTENSYTFRLLNASDKVLVLNAEVLDLDEGAEITGIGKDFEIAPGDPVSLPVQVAIPPEEYHSSDDDSDRRKKRHQKIRFKFSYHQKDNAAAEVRHFEEKAAFIRSID